MGGAVVITAAVVVVMRAVEGDAKVDLDLPAAHSDVIDDESHELLAVIEVEFVDSGGDTTSEVVDALA